MKRQWVQADLQCLQCGRLLGRLAGACERMGASYQFSVFRSSDTGQPLRRIRGNERFVCDLCGGNGLIVDIECFTTYDDPEDVPLAHHRGRRPTPMRPATDRRLIELGLAS